MRGFVVALVSMAWVAGAHAHGDGPEDVPTAHLLGGGAPADDCLAGLEVVGVEASERAKTVTCHDGDPVCDHDKLVNGRCEFWLRSCLNMASDRCSLRGVTATHVGEGDADADTDVRTVARTMALVPLPAEAEETCGALTTFTVPLGTRKNGSARKGRKGLSWAATGTDGTVDTDTVRFLCKPPKKEKRKGGISFDGIQARIFQKNCAFSGCHGLENPQGNLVLVGDAVYENIVDKLASTSAAQFAGKKLVVPGAPETSFLMDKLRGRLGPGEGVPMPLGRSALGDDEIEAIRKWILAGAPRDRVIGGGLAGELDTQPRIPAPPVPADGFQAHMTPFPMGDLPETEGCQMVRLGNPEAFYARQWELFMHEGSHHFILRAHRCPDANNNGTSDCDEPGFDEQFPTGFAPCEQFGSQWAFVVGSQTPHYLVDYQTATTGVAFELHKNQPLILNSHYTNPFADTQAEVWVNVRSVDAALVTHPARILFETVANAFIKVPPGTENQLATASSCRFATHPFCDALGEPVPTASHFALLGVTSHMHKRSHKFRIDLFEADGTTRVVRDSDMTDAADGSQHMYVSTDYSDPVNLAFWPPIIVENGQQLTYTCFHENGVRSPVRLGCEEEPGVTPGKSILEQFLAGDDVFAGAARWCRTDADCTDFGTGRCVPAHLVFGELADDDMCIEPGLYYPCAGGPETCVD